MAERLYVSNKNETVRMFESDFMEFFSRVHPAVPLILYLPVIGYMLSVSVWHRHLPVATVVLLFLLGILLWTLLEYLIHRYIFHYEPKTRVGKRLHFVVHGVHHDYPQDASRLVAPPAFSLPVAAIFYLLFLGVFGRVAPAPFAGFLFGYLCYDMIHYATHHFSMKRGVGLWLKQYHLRHHYKDDANGYGVSNPLWDYVFRTRPPRPEASRDFVSTPNH